MSKTKITYYMDIDESGAVRGAGRVENELEGVDRQAKKTEGRLSSLSGVMTGALVGALGLAFGQGMRMAIDVGGEFESKLSELNAITGISGDRLQRLGDRSLQMSSKYGTAASEVVEANKLVASQLAQKIDFNTAAGFQQLQQITEQAIVLQKAAGIPLQNAVDATARSINQFNLRASQGNKVINTMAAGAKYGAAEIPYITQAMVDAGTAAYSAGQGIGITTAAIEELAAKGQRAETTGRSLRAIFTRLQSKSKALAEIGIQNVDIKTDGLIKTLHKLRPLLHNTTALTRIFGQENINQIQILVNNADAIEKLNGKMKGTNTAYEQAKENMDNFNGAMDRLWQTIKNKAIVAFNKSSGALTAMASDAQYLVSHLGDLIRITLNVATVLGSLTAGYYGYQAAVKLATLWERRAAIARLFSAKAQRALNVAMEANPIGAIIGVLVTLGTVLATNGKAWQGFKTLISGVWDFLMEAFRNLPQVALNSFRLLDEILIAPFKVLWGYTNNMFSDLTSNFWHFLSAIKKGITGDFRGAWSELKAIGASAGGNFVQAAQNEMATLGDRVHAVAASANFGPAVDQMAAGGAQMGSALANMFTLTASAGVAAGSGQVAAKAGQQLSNTKVGPNGEIIPGGSGAGEGASADPMQSGFARPSTITGTQGQNFDVAAIQARVAARKKEAAQMEKISGLKAKSANQEKTLAQLSGARASKQQNALGITAEQWGQVAARTGQAAARAIEYSKTASEALGKVIDGVINQVIALWVRNAVQTAGASGPAALFVTPVLTAVATKAAHALMDPLTNFGGGGLLSGPYHSQGGIPARVGHADAVELEGDEYVMNRESTRRGLPVINAMNADPAFAEQLSNHYVGRSGALTINAMPASSPVAQSKPRDIAGEVARGIRAGLQQATLVAPVQIRRFDDDLQDSRTIERQIGNEV